MSSREPDVNNLGTSTLLRLFSHIEFIKQQMARDNVQFVRFESIDLHGVSRSKNVPSRFFHVSLLVSSCTFMCLMAVSLIYIYIIIYYFLFFNNTGRDVFRHCDHPFLCSPK